MMRHRSHSPPPTPQINATEAAGAAEDVDAFVAWFDAQVEAQSKTAGSEPLVLQSEVVHARLRVLSDKILLLNRRPAPLPSFTPKPKSSANKTAGEEDEEEEDVEEAPTGEAGEAGEATGQETGEGATEGGAAEPAESGGDFGASNSDGAGAGGDAGTPTASRTARPGAAERSAAREKLKKEARATESKLAASKSRAAAKAASPSKKAATSPPKSSPKAASPSKAAKATPTKGKAAPPKSTLKPEVEEDGDL